MNSLAFENKKEVKKSITRKKLELRDFNAFKHGGSSSARVYTNDQVAIVVTSVWLIMIVAQTFYTNNSAKESKTNA